jgi:cytochrome P450/NADPH-cytochrome P450 reductase
MKMNIKIPQDQAFPLIGNLLELDTKEGFFTNAEKLATKHGEIYRLSLPASSFIIVSSHRIINELCDEKRFKKTLFHPLRIMRDLTKDGLFTAYGDEPNWIRAHRILTPAFGPMSIRSMFPQMLDIAEQLVLKWERMGEDARLDVAVDMTRLTLDTIALCAFDYRFNSFYKEEMHPFVHSMVESLGEAADKGRRLPIQDRAMFWTRKKYENNIDYMNRVADVIIEKRKEDGVENGKNDLLSKMLMGKDPETGEGLSDENIRFQMLTFLIAGHETTSGLLSFSFYYLCKNPKTLEKAQEEVNRVLGNKQPKVDQINQLEYLSQVLKEALRLRPTAPITTVEPLEDTTIGGEYEVKKGETIINLMPALHRDKAVWGEDPEVFEPARFSKENFSKLPPNSWKPFGNGARACIGQPFAMQEAILVLAMVLQRFDLSFADADYELKVEETLTVKPEGFYLKAKRNNNTIEDEKELKKKQNQKNKVDELKEVEDPKLLILYGSDSGTSRIFALQLAKDSEIKGFRAKVGVLDDYVDALPTNSKLIIVTASYEGQPTNNAKNFVKWIKEDTKQDLSGLEYCVFGCGNKDWFNTYQAIPTLIDSRLSELGAKRFFARGEADAKADFSGAWEAWEEKLWSKLEDILEVSDISNKETTQLSIEVVDTPIKLKQLQQTQLRQGKVIANRELVNLTDKRGRSKKHLEIELPGSMRYRAGDYLAILPINRTNNIQRVLTYFSLEEATQLILKDDSGMSILPLNYPISIGEILRDYVELGQPITRRQVEFLAKNTPCPPERIELEQWCQKEVYPKAILEKRMSLIDVLQRMGSCSISFNTFLSMLPALQIRQYSISSSPIINPAVCSLTLAVVDAAAWSGQGNYQGVASNYLSGLEVGDSIWLEVVASKEAFHLPENTDLPIIMVGAGSGLAPFRGFIQERARLEAAEKMLLFFGCDHPDIDFLYQGELMAWQGQGVLDVFPAFTFQELDNVKYVQHRVWKERALVWDALERGAIVYVCGDGKYMAPGVKEVFMDIYAEKMNASKSEAAEWLLQLVKNDRYVLDIF